MVISGLNKLGMQSAPQSAKNAKPSSDAKSSFGEVLGQVAEEKPKAAPKADVKDGKAQSKSVESNFSPVQPGVPTGVGAGLVEPTVNPALQMPGTPIPKTDTFLNPEESVDSLTRRVVWNDFLRKMKDELGVSAEDVLEAFASLSTEDLAKPPSESVDKIVMALGLSDQQASIAKQHFQELVNKTKSKSLGDELSASEKQISLTLMSQREMQRKTLQKSLEKMSNGFFLKNQPPAVAVTSAPPQQLNDAKLSQPSESLAGPAAAMPSFSSMPVGASAPTPTPPEMGMATSAEGKFNLEGLKANSNPENVKVDEMIRKFVSSQSQSSMAKPGEAAMNLAAPAAVASSAPAVPVAQASTTAPTAPSAAAVSALQNIFSSDRSLSGDSSEDEGDFTSDAAYLGGLAPESGTQSLNGPVQDFKSQMLAAAPEAMSVPEIVEQAQVMVRDGGGEMKVTLNQEGLGEVAMKVSVDQGKVNVQMITESDEAKKLIERQLGELKSQLSHNNLQLDSIKIDTATNLGKQLEQQHQDAQRQYTQAFMEQFRQENQGWRQSFFETPAQRMYKSQGQATRDVQAPLEPSARRANSRRLDLVA